MLSSSSKIVQGLLSLSNESLKGISIIATIIKIMPMQSQANLIGLETDRIADLCSYL